MRTLVTLYIIGYNEEANLRELLPTVKWADEILYVDSFSTDGTAKLCAEHGVRHVNLPFEGFGKLRNQAVALATHDWIVSIDTDERSTPEFATAVRRTLEAPRHDAYLVPRKNFFLGRWIRGCGWYPDYRQPQFFNRSKMRYREELVHETYELKGSLGTLEAHVLQIPWRTLDIAITKFQRYSALTARRYFDQHRRASVGRMIASPAAIFFKMFVLQRGFLDGRHGLVLCALYAYYTFLKYAKLWELELGSSRADPPDAQPDPRGSPPTA